MINKLQEELKEKEEEWKKENSFLNERINELGSKMERQDKEQGKNNIIIKGYKTDTRDVNKSIEEKLGST